MKRRIVATTEECSWLTSWVRAFPTLLSYVLHASSPEEEGVTIPRYLSLVAFDQIFSHDKFQNDQNEIKDERVLRDVEKHDCNSKEEALNLGYGEILPESMMDVVEEIMLYSLKFLGSKKRMLKKVIDLGSGRGRTLFATALACPSAKTFVGVEISSSLHREALDHQELWRRSSLENEYLDFHFVCEDMRNDVVKEHIWGADLVVCHATLFSEELMSRVQDICESSCCLKGCFFVMVSRCLAVGDDTGIENCELGAITRTRMMDWGPATVYVQRKVW